MSNRGSSRRAFAASLLFPWLLFPSPQPPEGEQPPVETPPASKSEALIGVVVESVGGWTLEKAGVQAGDVLLRWKRLPAPPANPEPAEGVLTGYFDWEELLIDQAPRGTVVLTGRRGDEPEEFTVEPGFWDAKVRPVLPPKLVKIYERGNAKLSGGDTDGAEATWRALVDGVPEDDARDSRTWMLLRMGEAWGEKGKGEKAVELGRLGVEVATSVLAAMVGKRAVAYGEMRSGELGKAETEYTSMLELQRQIDSDTLAIAYTLSRLGHVEWERENLPVCRQYHQEALSLREKAAPLSLDVAESLDNLGTVSAAQGELDLAAGFLKRGLQIREALAPESSLVASSFNGLGFVAFERGEVDTALRYHTQALRLFRQLAPESPAAAVSLNNLGVAQWAAGDLRSAEDAFEQANRLQRKFSPRSLDMAQSLSNLGVIAQQTGDLDRASQLYSEALSIEEKVAPRSLATSSSLSNLGKAALGRGDLASAERLYWQALRVEEKLAPKSLAVAGSLNNLGELALARRNLSDAHKFLRGALDIKERVAPGSLDVALSLNILAEVEAELGQIAKAEKRNRQAVRIQEKFSPKSLTLARSLNDIGFLRQRLGKPLAAEAFYLRALEIRSEYAPHSLKTATSLRNLGSVRLSLGDFRAAYSYYLRALETLEHQLTHLGGSYSIEANFRTQHRAYYFDFLDLLLGQKDYSETFQTLERYRAQTFLAMLAERDIAFSADIPVELDRERRRIGVLYDRTLKKLGTLNPRDHPKEIEAAQEELRRRDDEAGDIEVQIRKASPRLAALRYPEPLDAERSRQALDPGTLLLSWSLGKDKSALFTLGRDTPLEVRTIPIGEEALRARVRHLLTILPEALGDSSLATLRRSQLTTASRELYDLLLAPAANRIAASERLLILPDGPLHELPFGALLHRKSAAEGERDEYLAAWKPLHVALSASVFAELKGRRRTTDATTSAESPPLLAAFGDPVYPTNLPTSTGGQGVELPVDAAIDPVVRGATERGLFDWKPLPYTRREVEGIAALFPPSSVRTFLGPEALEERIKTLDRNTRILHLAAHSGIDEHLPSNSFVALTVPPETSEVEGQPKRDNGLLQVWEIVERVRIDADLVVLSACESGLGAELGGEGLIGLTRAFQYAGARSVVASLWNVNDQATAELMIRFYRHLRAGKTKDEALRAAQRELIEGPIEIVDETGAKHLFDASAPYYWAAFQVYGDWQ